MARAAHPFACGAGHEVEVDDAREDERERRAAEGSCARRGHVLLVYFNYIGSRQTDLKVFDTNDVEWTS